MVKSVIITLLLTLASTPAAARLSATLDKKATTFGEPVQLRIVANADLATLDTDPLKKDFEVFSSAVSGGTQNGKVQSVLEATLYPLRAGKLTLPALALGNARLQPLTLEVQPANVSLRAWVSPETPMAREPATLHLEIRDEGDLTWNAPTQIDAPNVHLGAQAESTREALHDGAPVRLREYRWPLLALKSGSTSVTFPILDAYKFGQRLRYPVTAVTFRTLPAPAYLPLYLPIGQPAVRAAPLPQEIFLGRPASRVLDIIAPGLSAEGALKSLQFDPPRGMRLYAPSVASIKIDGQEGLRVTLSFVAEETGVSAFPAIKLPYFDPKTQRIETLTIPAAHLTVRDPLREKIIAAGFILLAVLCLTWLGIKAWPWLMRLRAKRAWLARLDAASDVAALYRVLTRDAPWRANTLRQSARNLNADMQLTNSLERLRFGAGAPEVVFVELKSAWREAGMQAPVSAF